jgi:hypothetical protein
MTDTPDTHAAPDPASTGGAGQGSAYGQQPPPPPTAPPGPAWQQRDPFNPFDPRRKSPALASVMSLVPGLGQVYIGFYLRGFMHLLTVAGTIAILAEGHPPDIMYPLLGLFLPFFWLYNIVDAGRRAALYNAYLEGMAPQDLPRDMAMPGGGSLGGGIALIVGGCFLLLHTLGDFSLAWLHYWWPIIPIFIGIYLVARGMLDRSQQS